MIDFTRWLFDSEVSECGGVTRIEDPEHRGPRRHFTERHRRGRVLRLVRDGQRLHGRTGHRVRDRHPSVPRATLTGSAGSIELIGDSKLVVRRRVRTPRRRSSRRPHRERRTQRWSRYFQQVAEALRTGTQIAPSFDDGVAVAQVMDRLRANAIQAVG